VGDLAGGDEPSHEDGAREAAPQQDVARIADAVRESVGAGAALISRVVDDDWLEIVAVSGRQASILRALAAGDKAFSNLQERLTAVRRNVMCMMHVAAPDAVQYVTPSRGHAK